MIIARGTTPTITYTFNTVRPADIIVAYLTLSQFGETILEKDLLSAGISETSLSWKLSQAETLQLNSKVEVVIQCRYRLNDNTAHATKKTQIDVGEIIKEGEI